MPIAKYRTHKINYSIQGEGPTIVFLHGFGLDLRMWTDFIPAFEDFQVICIDLPGFGQSDSIPNISIPLMAKTIKAVLDQEKIEKSVLIGHSMGGYVSLAFAKKYDYLLKGFGLFNSHPYSDTEKRKKNRTKSVSFVERHGVPIYLKHMIPLLFAKEFANTNTHVLDKVAFYGSQTSIAGFTGGLKAMRDRVDNSNVLQKTTLPVLFIVGKQDTTMPLENSLNQLSLPVTSDIHIYEDAGHMGMFEAKKETIKAILEFTEFCEYMMKEGFLNNNK